MSSHNIDAIEVVRHPENVNIVESESVQLNCTFDTAIDCVWFKNGQHVNIVDRYNYKFGTGQSTYDCTFIISSAIDHDRGSWHCASMTDSHGNPSITSNSASVNIEELKIVKHPKSPNKVATGKSIVLECEFNTQVNCIWMKNNAKINSGFYYINGEIKHCSIILVNVIKNVHEGDWTCVKETSANFNRYVQSKPATVKVYDERKIVLQPQNTSVIENAIAVFDCIFDDAVECVWFRNESTVNINGRYEYKTKVRSEFSADCSITISNVSKDDRGFWLCSHKADPESVKSQIVWLVVEEIKHPADACVVEREASLDCVFNAPFECIWYIHGQKVNMIGTYIIGCRSTKDCSISIDTVESDENGEWQCSNSGKIPSVSSKKILLNFTAASVPDKTTIKMENSTEIAAVVVQGGYIAAIVILIWTNIISIVVAVIVYKIKLKNSKKRKKKANVTECHEMTPMADAGTTLGSHTDDS